MSSVEAHPSSVRDNCSFASDPKRTLRLEVSEVRLSSEKDLCSATSVQAQQSSTEANCMSSAEAHPSSVRDNCSFASDPKRTLRLEVSEVRLSSEKDLCSATSVQAQQSSTEANCMSSAEAHPSSVRDNCSFASDPKRTLRLEVSEVRLSSEKDLCSATSVQAQQSSTEANCQSFVEAHPSSVRDNCSFASDPKRTLRLEVSEVRLSSEKDLLPSRLLCHQCTSSTIFNRGKLHVICRSASFVSQG